MPANGGYAPSPERYGGATPSLQRHIESLGAALGTAYDTTTTSGIVFARLYAYARAVWEAWENNQRLANQWNAQKVTDFIPRWEKIYGLSPLATDTLVTRRNRIAIAQARAGVGTFQAVNDALATALGACFVGIITTSSGSANVWTPIGWPLGSHDTSPPTIGIDWYSTIAYLAVQVTQPASMNDADFYNTVGQIVPLLDAILPAWVSFAWFRTDIHGSAGFFLDEGKNLDNEAFNP